MKRKQKIETKYRKRFASVTQWQSNRLLTGRLRVRVPPGALMKKERINLMQFLHRKICDRLGHRWKLEFNRTYGSRVWCCERCNKTQALFRQNQQD